MSMSWTSRFNNLGRFSPFTRSPQTSYSSTPKVSDSDFSYITADDLRQHVAPSVSAVTDGLQSESPTDYGPGRETDVLVLRNKRQDYWVHFAAYSIAKGELKVKDVREAAAKKMGASDPSRVKLIYRGRNLKDDDQTAKEAGLKDEAELLVTVAETHAESDGDSGSEEDDDRADSEVVDADGTRRRRNRGKKTKRRNKREAAAVAADQQNSGRSTPTNLNAGPARSQNASRTASPKPPTPMTPIDKLNALKYDLESFLPQVDAFIKDPPTDQAKRDFEHKRLTETIFTKVQLKLDEVSTEGDEDARTKRKELVKESLAVLARLDAVMKK